MPACWAGYSEFYAQPNSVEWGDANLLTVRVTDPTVMSASDAPMFVWSFSGDVDADASAHVGLAGVWQFRIGDDPSFATLPLPAIYGASPDILFEP
jgi:hypothetical protein